MRKKIFLFISIPVVAATGFFFLSRGPLRPVPAPPVLVGILVRGATYAPGVEGFKTRMTELGYAQGSRVTYVIRYVDKREDIAPAVSQFLKLGVSLFVTFSTPVTSEVYKQTKTVPVVFGSIGDPLNTEFVESLQHPGKNVTGVSSLSVPLVAKRLEFLSEAIPAVRKVAFPFTQEDSQAVKSYAVVQESARNLGIKVIPYYITKDRSVEATAAAIRRSDVDGIVLAADSLTWANLNFFIATAGKEKLPFAVFDKDMVAKGGLLGYGPDYFISGQQAAVLADKILRGQHPQELPIEPPQKFIFAVNLDTARAIGVALPKSILEKADLIIDKN